MTVSPNAFFFLSSHPQHSPPVSAPQQQQQNSPQVSADQTQFQAASVAATAPRPAPPQQSAVREPVPQTDAQQHPDAHVVGGDDVTRLPGLQPPPHVNQIQAGDWIQFKRDFVVHLQNGHNDARLAVTIPNATFGKVTAAPSVSREGALCDFELHPPVSFGENGYKKLINKYTYDIAFPNFFRIINQVLQKH